MKTIAYFSICALLSFSPALRAIDFSPEKARQIDRQVQAYLDLDMFSGVVLISIKGEPVYAKAFGLADHEKGTPITLDTRFDIGSMNKTFTRVVILQMIDEGLLNFDDPLGEHLSGFPAEVAERVTIEHLLNHRSGFGDYHRPEFMDQEDKSISAVVELAHGEPLYFEPGSESQYSNLGFVLLGAVIEKVSGNSYYNEVEERIVKPLGLQSLVLRSKSKVPQRAHGYTQNYRGELMDNQNELSLPRPDGGFHSTARDIAAFYHALFQEGALLSPGIREKDRMFRYVAEAREKGGVMPVAGGFPGANTIHIAALKDDYSVTVMANRDEPVGEMLAKDIMDILKGESVAGPQLPAVRQIYQAYLKHGPQYIVENFESLSGNSHPQDPPDLILNQLGYDLLFDGQLDDALIIFQLNTELFPEVANVWDSLAEAYLEKGEQKLALQYYRKALSIRPNLPSAKRAVERLQEAVD